MKIFYLTTLFAISLLIPNLSQAGCEASACCAEKTSECGSKCSCCKPCKCKKCPEIVCCRTFCRTVKRCCKCKTQRFVEITFRVTDCCGRTKTYRKVYKEGDRRIAHLN